MIEDASRHSDQCYSAEQYREKESVLCPCCEISRSKEMLSTPKCRTEHGEDVLDFKGTRYRINDFVYIIPQGGEVPHYAPYTIGQLKEINLERKVTRIHLQLFQRQTDYCSLLDKSSEIEQLIPEPLPIVRDERQLFMTGKFIDVNATELEGKCKIRFLKTIPDINGFKKQRDAFWVMRQVTKLSESVHDWEFDDLTEESIPLNQYTLEEQDEEEKKIHSVVTGDRKIAALDIFSGCGGLSLGMHSSGLVETKHAIEFSPSAAITFKYALLCFLLFTFLGRISRMQLFIISVPQSCLVELLQNTNVVIHCLR